VALVRLPGLIDPHVHLREPGGTHKEDFESGSRAAVAGGFTFILDMPNNEPPTTSVARLEAKIALAEQKSVCNIGFHYGTDGRNTGTFEEAARHPQVFGLKVYLDPTTGNLMVVDPAMLDEIFDAWDSQKPILVHAEGGEKLGLALELASRHGRRLHVCHISQARQVELVRAARTAGASVTAGACPHHLWLTAEARAVLHGFAVMKPPLEYAVDQEALWEGLRDQTVDLIETDHAPHTRAEKAATPAPFGVPGLETALGLTLRGVSEGRLPADAVSSVLSDRAAEIFAVPRSPDTYIETDPAERYTIDGPFQTKCGWSPFRGWHAFGRPTRVVIGGRELVRDGQLLV
jgi:dihydroorotase